MAKKPSVMEALEIQKELMKMRKEQSDAERKLQQVRHNLIRAENSLEAHEKEDRRKRNHRLITRGAQIEYKLPEVREFTEDQFIEFCNLLFDNHKIMDYTLNIIQKIKERG